MGGFNDFSTTASSNASVGAINFAEGQLPSTVNNSARQLMADLADVRDGNVVATGLHVKANGLTIRDQSDTTKKVIFDVSGQSAGTTKTIAMPITSGTLALAADTAPIGASYVVVGSNGTLTAERVLTAGSNVTLTDSSTAGTVTIATSLKIAQVVNTQTGALATGTTTIPADDSIPQNTEGNEYMTLAITPTNASSTLLIDVVWNGATSATGNNMTVALFQDTTAGALAAASIANPTANGGLNIEFRHKMTAGTTSATTFKVRAGYGAAGTTSFNGSGGGRIMGGVLASSITITEILP